MLSIEIHEILDVRDNDLLDENEFVVKYDEVDDEHEKLVILVEHQLDDIENVVV